MARMRWARLLLCCLFMAFTCAGAAPLLAADLKQAYPDERPDSDAQAENDMEEYCYAQRQMCHKICRLRFREDLIGCPQTCETRVSRCMTTGCYRWTEPELLIAERFGGAKCPQ